MAASNITGLTNLATPQPTMLLYAALSPSGVTDDRKISANALFSTITANISDLSVQWDNGLGTASVSAANKGKIRYNSTTQTFQVSQNGAAYVDLITGGTFVPAGNNKQIQFNNSGAFGGAAGVQYQSGGSPNVSITAQNNAHTALLVKPASNSFTVAPLLITNTTASNQIFISPGGASTPTGQWLELTGSGAAITIIGDDTTAGGFASASLDFYSNTDFSGNSAFISIVGPLGGNTILANIPNSVFINPDSASTGGLVLVTTAAAPIIFGTGGTGFTNERARISGTGAASFTCGARSSGSVTYFQVRTPADTALAAGAECIGVQIGGNASAATVTRTFATGAITTQREYVFVAPTYAFAGASTISTASTVTITGEPVAGANCTITNGYALDVTGDTRITGKLTVTGGIDPTYMRLSGSTDLYYESANGSGAAVSASNEGRIRYNSSTQTWQMSVNGAAYADIASTAAATMAIGGTVASGTTGSVLFIGSGPVLAQDSSNLFWDDSSNRLGIGTSSPSWSLHISGNVNSDVIGQIQNSNSGSSAGVGVLLSGNSRSYVIGVGSSTKTPASATNAFFVYDSTAGGNAYRLAVDSTGRTSINPSTSTATGTLHVFGHSTSVEALDVESMASLNGGIPVGQFTISSASTNQITAGIYLRANSNAGAGSAGFGTGFQTQLESSTTTNQDASSIATFWTTATHASRTSTVGIFTVTNASAYAEVARFGGASGCILTPPARSSGSPTHIQFLTPADSGLAADTESIFHQIGGNSSAATVTRTFTAGGGAFALQREVVIVAPTYAFTSADTITTAVTLAITGPPIAGTNATLTNRFALTCGGAVQITCNATSHEGLFVRSNSGAIVGSFHSDGTDLFIGATTNHTVSLISNGSANIRFTDTTVGFYGVSPVVRQTAAAAATDLASVITLANQIRQDLIDLGLFQA